LDQDTARTRFCVGVATNVRQGDGSIPIRCPDSLRNICGVDGAKRSLESDGSARIANGDPSIHRPRIQHVANGVQFDVPVGIMNGDGAAREGTSFHTTVVGGAYHLSADIGKRSEEHTSELQSPCNLVCRLLLEKKKRPYVYTVLSRHTYTAIRRHRLPEHTAPAMLAILSSARLHYRLTYLPPCNSRHDHPSRAP